MTFGNFRPFILSLSDTVFHSLSLLLSLAIRDPTVLGFTANQRPCSNAVAASSERYHLSWGPLKGRRGWKGGG